MGIALPKSRCRASQWARSVVTAIGIVLVSTVVATPGEEQSPCKQVAAENELLKAKLAELLKVERQLRGVLEGLRLDSAGRPAPVEMWYCTKDETGRDGRSRRTIVTGVGNQGFQDCSSDGSNRDSPSGTFSNDCTREGGEVRGGCIN